VPLAAARPSGSFGELLFLARERFREAPQVGARLLHRSGSGREKGTACIDRLRVTVSRMISPHCHSIRSSPVLLVMEPRPHTVVLKHRMISLLLMTWTLLGV
jgi:hypothetical protein